MIKHMHLNTKDKEMSISEHLDELRQRILSIFVLFVVLTGVSFLLLKPIILLLQKPASGVKFLQLAPGEYFFVSIKVACYCGFLLCLPIAIYQVIMFILPGLTNNEAKLVVPSLFGSVILFFAGLFFGYTALAPAALSFFISYGSELIEPLWSFEQYFDFIILLLISTGLSFQVPIIQVFLGIAGVVSSKQMLSVWRYILVIATVISAILTPSTDPFTQILMTIAIVTLYVSGVSVLVLMKK
uniref:Sec-independent protein translocase component TatC n=1 Tax=Yamadaella caenomyce TaxID=259029 RepID=A0A1G4NYN8_9FLOR|nr:Sec-independent protein translocase component TatC [Yamadaella caenomyce]SCW23811.1 Sec-independent protein translocase component TatC [Yamadaella caenomyce]